MARIFITGSSDGIGMAAARVMIAEGHRVVLHARNKTRADDALQKCPQAETVVIGDLSNTSEMKRLAKEVNALGVFDAVIHNAGVDYNDPQILRTGDGLPALFAINSLAPYVLTCLIKKPKRLIYVSSGLHRSGDASLKDLSWDKRPWNASVAYADSKLHNVLLAFAVARRWRTVLSNAIEPGWVPTKMGGPNAPDSLEEAARTEAWLAASRDEAALVSGKYFFHKELHDFHRAALDTTLQEKYLSECSRFSDVLFPIE